MCGIVGIFSHEPVADELYDSLIHLQHRGQDAAGILTCNERFYAKHGLGLVRDIYNPTDISNLKGRIGIGHTRYPTAGGYSEADVQPLWIGNPRGMALAHNGNLTNYDEMVAEICGKQHRHLNSSLDSEVLLLLLADYLAKGSYSDNNEDHFFAELCNAVQAIFKRVQGSYSIVGVVIGKGLIAFRDPHGIRPLAVGVRKHDKGNDYIFASETTPFYALGYEPLPDLQPGEVAYVNQTGKLYRKILNDKSFRPCAFEYVYFARPDSIQNEVSVYHSRLHMGQNLAKLWRAQHPDCLPDIVIPAPFTANTAALAFAQELGVRYSEGLYKNPFIGRTFIMPNQTARARSVRYKLTPQRAEIEGKNVLIVDDSIVRGTTSRQIVKMVRESLAKEIYFATTCPPIKFPCFYGIDIPSSQELIATKKNEAQIRDYLGVDRLLYLTTAELVEAITRYSSFKSPCLACMDGNYVCNTITPQKLQELETKRHAERI